MHSGFGLRASFGFRVSVFGFARLIPSNTPPTQALHPARQTANPLPHRAWLPVPRRVVRVHEWHLLFHPGLPYAARRFKVAIRSAGVVEGISKRIAMIEEELDVFDRDGKAQPLTGRDFHIGHADHFAAQVEERSAAIARIDLRRSLQI